MCAGRALAGAGTDADRAAPAAFVGQGGTGYRTSAPFTVTPRTELPLTGPREDALRQGAAGAALVLAGVVLMLSARTVDRSSLQEGGAKPPEPVGGRTSG